MENIDNKQTEARNRNLLRFIHAQDSGGIYDGTGTYAEALQEVKNGHKRANRRFQSSTASMDVKRPKLTSNTLCFAIVWSKSARLF